MQTTLDLICTECSNQYDSASSLLQHFANHAVEHLENEIILFGTDTPKNKSKIPNLYPINMVHDINVNETDRGSDSGIEDINPLKFCMVTMDEKHKLQSKVDDNENKDFPTSPKRYQCLYCLKRFGWSTDLKRHILIHTGERPFQCPDCHSAFTRNFLLQKHQKKIHTGGVSNKLPELRPIKEALLNKKRRKQHKFLIKRNMTSSDESTDSHLKHKVNGLLCSS